MNNAALCPSWKSPEKYSLFKKTADFPRNMCIDSTKFNNGRVMYICIIFRKKSFNL